MENYGWLSLVPPLTAIALAVLTREVVVSLLAGVVAGMLIISGGSLSSTFTNTLETIIGNIADGEWNARIIMTVSLMGGLVGLLNHSGASTAFARYAQSRVTNKRGAQLLTVVAGIFIFFDDYFNSLTIGSVMRPVADKFKVSREKLAYLIDSTAAPVCVLFPLSTWAAYILSLIAAEYAELGVSVTPLKAFLHSLPSNFYAFSTLALIIVIAYTGKDFGPMREAEHRTAEALATEEFSKLHTSASLVDIVLPVFALIVTTIAYMLALGGHFSGATLGEAFANTDSSSAMMYGSFTTVAITVLWYTLTKRLSLNQAMEALVDGMKSMMISLIILILAWSIGGVTKTLGTGTFVASIVARNLPPAVIPLGAFIASCIIAFSTGTSWGTFAIMLPIAVPMASASGLPMPLLIGAVLAGGIFGDHCSPISDTTILSSTGAGCNHIEHVRTQLPYALVGAAGSCAGYVVTGLAGSVLLGLTIAIGCSIGFYWLLCNR